LKNKKDVKRKSVRFLEPKPELPPYQFKKTGAAIWNHLR
jgi:hypothetical protein